MSVSLRLLIKSSTLFFLAVWLTACSSKQPSQPKIVIPQPPEEPRIFFLNAYHGAGDIEYSKTLDLLIGEDTGRSYRNLFKPYGVDAVGEKFYVSDTAIGVVFVFDKKKKSLSYLGDQPRGKLSLPVGITHDAQGNIYVSDAKKKKIFGYAPDGKLIFALGEKGEFERPAGIALNPALQRLYIVDTKAHKIKVYSLNGEKLFEFGKRGEGAGEFNYPTNIAIDRTTNNLIVSDTQNFRIQIFNQDGEYLYKFGEIGDRPGMFARPKGVAVDSEGHIYVADAAFSVVQIFDQKGRLLLYFGGHGGKPGLFRQITGLYMDEKDRLYIVDNISGSVQVFQYISEQWKKTHPKAYQELKSIKAHTLTKIPETTNKTRPKTPQIKSQFPKEEKLDKHFLGY